MNINGALKYQNQALRGQHIASYLLERTGSKNAISVKKEEGTNNGG